MMFLTKEKIVVSSNKKHRQGFGKNQNDDFRPLWKTKTLWKLIPKEGLREKWISHLRDSRWYFDHWPMSLLDLECQAAHAANKLKKQHMNPKLQNQSSSVGSKMDMFLTFVSSK
jgi:hypothetical protein